MQVFHDKMREAQGEIRSTMSVNTSEITSSSTKTEDGKDNDGKGGQTKRGLSRSNGTLSSMDSIQDDYNSGSRSKRQRSANQSSADVFHLSIRLGGTDDTAATLSAVGSTLEDLLAEQQRSEPSGSSTSSECKLSPKVIVMQPVFRFLQLLCENHNRDLQVNMID